MSERIEIFTRFKSQDMTAEDYIQFSQKVLSHLAAFHPIFNTIYSWGETPDSSIKIEEDFSNFQEVVFDHIYDDELNYLNPDPDDKEFHLKSKSYIAFLNSYTSNKKEDASSCSISISAGGNVAEQDKLGYINIKLPRKDHLELNELATIKKLISHLSEIVELESVYVSTDNLFDRVVDFNSNYDTEIGWLNYFKNKQVLKFIPNDISCEEVENGVFFWLGDEITEPNDDIVNKAISLRDQLAENGLLNF